MSSMAFPKYGSVVFRRKQCMKQYASTIDAACQIMLQDPDTQDCGFMAYQDWPTALRCLESLQNHRRHISEIVQFKQPCKPYLEIDGRMAEDLPECVEHPTVIAAPAQFVITDIFAVEYSIALTDNDFVWSRSSNAAHWSLRLVIATHDPQFVYASNHYADPQGAGHLVLAIRRHDPELGQMVDAANYTRDRCMRMVGSCKYGSPSILRLVERDEDSQALQDSTITWLDEHIKLICP